MKTPTLILLAALVTTLTATAQAANKVVNSGTVTETGQSYDNATSSTFSALTVTGNQTLYRGTDITLDSTQYNQYGAEVGANAGLALTGGTVTTSNTLGHGIHLYGNNAHAILSGGTISTEGRGARGLFLENYATFTGTDLFIHTSGSAITVSNTTFNAFGIFLTNYASGTLLSATGYGSSITTEGAGARGIQVEEHSTFTGSNVVIGTTGSGAHGFSVAANGTANVSDLYIHTTGVDAWGIRVEDHSTLTGTGIYIGDTGTRNAYGLHIATTSTANLTDTYIYTSGSGAYGVQVTTSSTLGADNLNIHTEGSAAHSLRIDNSATASVTNTSVFTTTGSGAHAISLNGQGSTLRQLDASTQLSSTGANAHAISVTGSAALTLGTGLSTVLPNNIAVTGSDSAVLHVAGGGTLTLNRVALSAYAASQLGADSWFLRVGPDGHGVINGALDTAGGGLWIEHTGTLSVDAAAATVVSATGARLRADGLLDLLSTISGSTLTVASLDGANTGTVALNGNSLIVNGTASGTFAGSITGADSNLTKTGPGTLTLSGSNTFSGTVSVGGGTLNVTDYTGTTASILVSNTAAIRLTGTWHSSGEVQLTGTSSLVLAGDSLLRNGPDGNHSANLGGSGDTPGSNVTATLQDNAKWEVLGRYVHVGRGATNAATLTIEGHAVLSHTSANSNAWTNIANNVGTSGTVIIRDSGWYQELKHVTVGVEGDGFVSISDSGSMTVGGSLFIGGESNYSGDDTNATGLVDITGGLLDVTGNIEVGASARGALNVSGNGTVSGSSMIIGNETTASGSVNVSGTSLINITNNLTVGGSGVGTLDITASGSVIVGGTSFIGNADTGYGSVTVSDTGFFSSTGNLYVGHSGTGTLNINGSGTVQNAQGYVGRMDGASGTVTVSDNAFWDNRETLFVGANGTGELLIKGNGQVQIGTTVQIGNSVTGYGRVTVSDTGRLSNNSTIFIGQAGVGFLDITDSGTVQNNSAAIGYADTGTGVVTVSGNGAWVIDDELYIGGTGAGTLNLNGSGFVQSGTGVLGYADAGYGAVTVSDTGYWHNTSNLTVGVTGSGALTVTGSGLVEVGGTYTQGANGALTVDLAERGAGDAFVLTDSATLGGTLTVRNYAGAISGSASGLSQADLLIIRSHNAIDGDFAAVTVLNGGTAVPTPDFIHAGGTTSSSGTDYLAGYRLSWNSGTTFSTGNFSLGDGYMLDEFILDEILADTDANDNWDGQSLTKIGDGTLIVTKAQSYTGTTTVADGVLVLTEDGYLADSALSGSGTLTLRDKGVFTFTASNAAGDFAGTVRLEAGDAGTGSGLLITADSTNAAVLADATLQLAAGGSGTISGTGNINFGALAIDGGKLAVDTDDSAEATFTGSAGSITVTSGTLQDLDWSLTTGTLNPALNFIDESSGISDDGLLLIASDTVTSAGQLVLIDQDGNSPTSGTSEKRFADTVTAYYEHTGLAGTNAAGVAGLFIDYNLVELAIATGSTFDLTTNGAINDLLLATVSGAGNLIISGTNALTLGVTNTHTGTTKVEIANLRAGADNVFGSGDTTRLVTSNTTTVDLNGKAQTIGGLEHDGVLDFNSGTLTITGGNGPSTVSGTLTGVGALTVQGDTLTITGANATLTVATTIDSGAAIVINDTLGLGTGDITVSGTLVLKDNVSGTFANALDGDGMLVKDSAQDVFIARANVGFTGSAQVNDGALTLTNLAAVGTAGIAVAADAVAVFTGVSGVLQNSVSGDGTLEIRDAALTATDSVTVNVGQINLTTGTVALDTTNTFGRNVAVDPASRVDFLRDGASMGNVNNRGLLNFAADGGFKTVTIGDLTGDGGSIAMNINLTAEQGDLLVTDSVVGTHRLILNRVDSPGNVTGRERILLVESTDSSAGAFVSDVVMDGMLQYHVLDGASGGIDNNPNNWWLTGKISSQGEVVLSHAAAASLGWFASDRTLLKRMGDLRLDYEQLDDRVNFAKHAEGDVWVRGYGQQINTGSQVSGAPFRDLIWGTDIGADKLWRLNERSVLYTGAFGGYQQSTLDFRTLTASAESDGYQGGLYATWLHDTGWYADLVGRAAYVDSRFDVWENGGQSRAQYHNWQAGGSLELGRKFQFQDGWFVEPQAQASYAHLFGADYQSTGANPTGVSQSDADLLQLRFGALFGRTVKLSNGGLLQPYVKVMGLKQVSSGGTITSDRDHWRPNYDGLRAQLGAGFIWQLDDRNQLHLDYEAEFGEKFDQPWGVTAGYRYQF
ncbi:MAG: autotransporter outer membrane beta-barrel domain-containing protein [Verrucomicrobiales bacterium]|jgi:outer membrane autotransporter protein|nr:autotransporter outer membrane beta-barrel domain-containing protein [Verrucomicrobiales bacterium]